MLVMTIFIYFPFARSYDKILLAQEQENQAEEER
jgi:PTS system cellobiose-specific IIC component